MSLAWQVLKQAALQDMFSVHSLNPIAQKQKLPLIDNLRKMLGWIIVFAMIYEFCIIFEVCSFSFEQAKTRACLIFDSKLKISRIH